MLILINSFPRSGTHLTIDSLCHNTRNCVFPRDKRLPKDFNYGSLQRDTPEITKAFLTHIRSRITSSEKHLTIKSHLMPSAILRISESETLSKETRSVFADIWNQAKKVYVYRDLRNVLVSNYYFFRRDETVPFSEFIRERLGEEDIRLHGFKGDEDFLHHRILYWGQHVKEWMELQNVIYLKYENLIKNFEFEISNLAQSLNLQLKSNLHQPKKKSDSLIGTMKNKFRKLGFNLAVESTGHFPKAQRGHWQEYFSNDDLEFMRSIVQVTLNNLGYIT